MKELRSPIRHREATWSSAISKSYYTLRAEGPTGVTEAQKPEPFGTNLNTVGAAQQVLKLQRKVSVQWEMETQRRHCPHRKKGRCTPVSPFLLLFHFPPGLSLAKPI